jgi:hypothetical protein
VRLRIEYGGCSVTMPARLAEPVAALHDLIRLKAPKEIPPIRYSMVWHPRFESDALHMWLRATVRPIFHPALDPSQGRHLGSAQTEAAISERRLGDGVSRTHSLSQRATEPDPD